MLLERRNRRGVLLLVRRSGWTALYLFVVGVLVEGEVEVEDGLFEVLGEVDFLSDWEDIYLYSLTMTVS